MAKIRVSDLAKELNLKSGEVLGRLRELGAAVKTNLSTVEEEVAGRLRAAVAGLEKKPAEATVKIAGVRPSTVTGKTSAAKRPGTPPQSTHSSAAQPAGTTAGKTPVIGTHPSRPAPPPPRPPVSGVAKPAAAPATRPAMSSQVRTAPVPAARPGAPPANPGFHPTSSQTGAPTRPAAPTTTRSPVPASTARPSAAVSPVRPAATRAPGTPALARPAGTVSPAVRTIQRNPLPAGQKPTPAPMRPLYGGATQSRVQRPVAPVPRTAPQGPKPALGSRPAGTG